MLSFRSAVLSLICSFNLNSLKVTADECIFLDDLPMNVKSARELGFTTIKVVDEIKAIQELEKLLGIPLLQQPRL